MRLIDADKLPYAMKDYFDGKKTIGQIIDDAPKVEMTEDCVKREDAKQFLYERLDRLNDDELYDIFSKIIDDMYNELPSGQPQPKKGKWLDKKTTIKGGHGLAYGRYGCSVCKKKQPSKTDFCPNCGCYCGGDDNVDE